MRVSRGPNLTAKMIESSSSTKNSTNFFVGLPVCESESYLGRQPLPESLAAKAA